MLTLEVKNRPPSFRDAQTRRQRARAAGLDPNYWYAVEQSRRLRKGEVLETRFWGRSIAIFRGDDGRVAALENRCAHRQIPLTEGTVEGCRLVCAYHGWSYGVDGAAEIPHDRFGHGNAHFEVETVPVRERYGLIHVFPGDPELADTRDIPSLPELEGPRPWPHVFVQFDCPSHHSMLLDNVSDFSHGHLHRKYQPFSGMELLRLETIGDRVELEYRSKIAAGFFQNLFIDRRGAKCEHMLACYDYPYHWSNTDDRIKHFMFTLPKDEENNRHIFIFYLSPKAFRLPGIGLRPPRSVQRLLLSLGRRFVMEPLLSQDVWILEREQQAWESEWQRPAPELNPVVNAFQDLTIRKWQEYLDARARSPAPSDPCPRRAG